jgi:hypothetical protein
MNEKEESALHRLVTLEELKEALSLFKKDKSPSPDGWTVEFFIHFFDLVSEDLSVMVDESRSRGHITRSLNSTFLSLIPKVNKLANFGDFRPISLCNIVYKVIEIWIKLIISKTLSMSLILKLDFHK